MCLESSRYGIILPWSNKEVNEHMHAHGQMEARLFLDFVLKC